MLDILFRELIHTNIEKHFIGCHIFEHAQLRTTFLSMFIETVKKI